MFVVKFSQLLFILQMPHLHYINEAEKLKGEKLTDQEKIELNRRVLYARRWLENIADEKQTTLLKEQVPNSSQNLSNEQILFCSELAFSLENTQWTNDYIKNTVFSIIERFDKKKCFEAIYLLFFDKTSGPQVSWFLSSLDKNFVIERLRRIK